MIFNYYCLNKECDSHTEKIRSYKTPTGSTTRFGKIDVIKIEKEEGDDSNESCPYCNELLKRSGTDSVHVFGKMGIMNSAQKQQMMLKRSREHASKGEVRDRTQYLNSITNK